VATYRYRKQFWGVNLWRYGPKSKIEEQRFVECHMEKWRPKNGSIPSKNKKEESI